jgi:hypothetical protein
MPHVRLGKALQGWAEEAQGWLLYPALAVQGLRLPLQLRPEEFDGKSRKKSTLGFKSFLLLNF